MNAVYPFFLGKLFAGEELFKQGLIGFGNCLRERLDQTVYTVAELFRYSDVGMGISCALPSAS